MGFRICRPKKFRTRPAVRPGENCPSYELDEVSILSWIDRQSAILRTFWVDAFRLYVLLVRTEKNVVELEYSEGASDLSAARRMLGGGYKRLALLMT